ncbi:MAG: molybdopterin-guanine dinucleotide biosynthesis protein MobB [Steroidobacteraceae bacterium]
MPQRVVGIVGRKDSGKTQLVLRLVELLVARGRASRPSSTRTTTTSSSTARARTAIGMAAGVHEVIVASDRRWALFHGGARTPPLAQLLERLEPCDLVLVEGYKSLEDLRRIEVWRGAAPGPLAMQDPGIDAIACPAGCVLPDWPGRPMRLDLDDAAAIAARILPD